MCKFIIVKTLDGQIFRKGTAYCESGMKGDICIDTGKIYAPPNPQTILIKTGNATVSTSSITSIIMENLMQLSVAIIELDVIAPQLERFKTAKIEHLQQMYFNMKTGGDIYPVSVTSPTASAVDSVHTIRTSGHSRVRSKAPSTVGPGSSISQVSRTSSRRSNNINHDENGSVGDWIEKSSNLTIGTPRSQRGSQTAMGFEGSIVSRTSTSRGSKHVSSYAAARQMAIYE